MSKTYIMNGLMEKASILTVNRRKELTGTAITVDDLT